MSASAVAGRRPAAVSWPVSGSAVAELPLAADGLRRSTAHVSPGGLPVWIAQAPTAGDMRSGRSLARSADIAHAPGRIAIQVLSRAVTKAAGYDLGVRRTWAVGPAPLPCRNHLVNGTLWYRMFSLDHNSGAVEGQTAGQNSQPGYIERAQRPCLQDDSHSHHWTSATNLPDLCWRIDNARIVWNARATELVPVGGLWRLGDESSDWVMSGVAAFYLNLINLDAVQRGGRRAVTAR